MQSNLHLTSGFGPLVLMFSKSWSFVLLTSLIRFWIVWETWSVYDEVLIPLFEVKERGDASFIRLKDVLLLHFIITESFQITTCLWIRLQMSNSAPLSPWRRQQHNFARPFFSFSIQSIWISLLLHAPHPPLPPASHSVPGGIPEPAWTRPGARPGTRPEQVKLLPVSFAQATVSGWIKASQVCNSHGNEPTDNMNGSLKISLNRSETTLRVAFSPPGNLKYLRLIQTKINQTTAHRWFC